MDAYVHRTAGINGSSKREPNLACRDPKHEDKNIQHCNRIGCSTNLNYMKGNHTTKVDKPNCSRTSFRSACSKALANMGNLEKPNSSKATLRSTCSKSLAGSSSASISTSSVFKQSRPEPKSWLSSKGTSITDSSSSASSSISRQDIQDLDFIDAREQTQDLGFSTKQHKTSNYTTTSRTDSFQSLPHNPDSLDSTQGYSTNTTRMLASGNSISTSRSHRQKLGNINQDTYSSSAKRCSVSRSTSETSKPISQTNGTGSQKYGLKNLGCTSISDVLPTSWPSSDVSHDTRVQSVKKRPSEGERTARGKSIIGSSSEGRLGSQHSKLPGPGVSTPECLTVQGSRNSSRPSSGGGALSVRTRPAPARETRMRLSEQGDNSTSSHLEPLVIPELQVYTQDVPEIPLRAYPLPPPPVPCDSFRRRGSSSRSAHNRSLPRSEERSRQHYNMETAAEVLLALERIEHDEDLSFEQLMVLEMNLYLGGMNFHDQHRDMRMDIDNMSYEELLALEEKIGTVSTALSEEAISKCLRRSIFLCPTLAPAFTPCTPDIKCSICQEEFVSGDEVGRLACEHRYHVVCIHQWLRLKNWCPICKSSAVPSS